MVLNVHRNHKAYWGRGDGWQGGMEAGEEGDYISVAKEGGYIYLSLHCHHRNDSDLYSHSMLLGFRHILLSDVFGTSSCPNAIQIV